MDRRKNELAPRGAETARVFKGFPVPFTSNRLDDMQRVIDLARNGDVEIVQLSVMMLYWHDDGEGGWELHMGREHMKPVGEIPR
jgi:hypothetical protein